MRHLKTYSEKVEWNGKFTPILEEIDDMFHDLRDNGYIVNIKGPQDRGKHDEGSIFICKGIRENLSLEEIEEEIIRLKNYIQGSNVVKFYYAHNQHGLIAENMDVLIGNVGARKMGKVHQFIQIILELDDSLNESFMNELLEGKDFIPNSDAISDIDNILLDLKDEGFGVSRTISANNKEININIYRLINGVQNAFNINSIKDVILRLYNYVNIEGYKSKMIKNDSSFKTQERGMFNIDDFPSNPREMEMIWHFTMKIIN